MGIYDRYSDQVAENVALRPLRGDRRLSDKPLAAEGGSGIRASFTDGKSVKVERELRSAGNVE